MKINTNGIELFYEVVGQGHPLLLIHGNGEDHHIFDKLVETLSNDFTCYLIDSRGHGKSSNVDSFNYQDMANDISEFITKLKLEKVNFYGFSDGGIIGLMLAYQYPKLLSKLIISGANINPSGLKTKWTFLFKIIYFFTRDKKIKMLLLQPQIPLSKINTIECDTLVLAGSKDMIKEKHTKLIAKNISNSTLKILNNETHSSYVVKSDKLYNLINNFIN